MKQHFFPDYLLDTNRAGIELIKKSEAFRANWYVCPAGELTIGYGSTEKYTPGLTRENTPGPISRAQAERLLKRQLIQQYERGVEENVQVPLTSNQFAALVSLVYNIGVANLRRSTLLRRLNARRYEAAADQFLRWKYAGGEVWGGLVKRRKAERALFLEEPEIAVRMPLEPLEPLAVMPTAAPLPAFISARL